MIPRGYGAAWFPTAMYKWIDGSYLPLMNSVRTHCTSELGGGINTPFCLISVGLPFGIIKFYRHYRLLPTKVYHVLRCAYYLFLLFGQTMILLVECYINA